MTRADKGIPCGRAPEVNLRNNHTQYIFTWYVSSFFHPTTWPFHCTSLPRVSSRTTSKIAEKLTPHRYALSAATSVMLWMVIKKPAGGVARRVRQSREW